ncbi:MAG: hypothetical protein ACP5TE_14315 [Verrucomicrobiia bacterium]
MDQSPKGAPNTPTDLIVEPIEVALKINVQQKKLDSKSKLKTPPEHYNFFYAAGLQNGR